MPELKKENTMTPQVRETEQSPVAVSSTNPAIVPVNVLQIAKPVFEITAPAPDAEHETGKSMVDQRRRRRARMSNRH